ncbi:MAG: hypothetical protein E4H27_03030 [Anaerolineales bacterium]|nr:MAG: hypothetical protein E4H27_03030 [Anaerolineales bacterium]
MREDSNRTKIPKLKVQVARYLPIVLILGLAVHLLLPQITALEHSLDVIRKMAWWAVGLAIFAQVSSYLGNGYTLQSLVRIAKENITLLKSTAISIAAASIGLVAGGMVGTSAGTVFVASRAPDFLMRLWTTSTIEETDAGIDQRGGSGMKR